MTVPGQSQPVPYGKTPESGKSDQSSQPNQQNRLDLTETPTWRRPPPALGQYGIAGRYGSPPVTGRREAPSATTGAIGGSAPSDGGAPPYGTPVHGPPAYGSGPSGYGSPPDAAAAQGFSAGGPSYGIVVDGAPTYGRPPCAPAQEPPTRIGSRSSRRKRTALVVSLVVAALVLSAGIGAAVLMLRGRGGGVNADPTGPTGPNSPSSSTSPTGGYSAASTSSRWSSAWLDGFEEAWTLDAPPAHGDHARVRIVRDKLIRTVNNGGTVIVDVFSLEKGAPELLWNGEVDGTALWISIWQNGIVIGNTLIDIDSFEKTTAPWDANALVSVVNKTAIACVGTTCAAWASMSEKKWESTIPVTGRTHVLGSTVVNNYALASNSDRDVQYAVVDVTTGEAKSIDVVKGMVSPQPLADGWLVYVSNHRGPATISLYEADGTLRETFTSGVGDDFTVYPWSPTRFTLDQAGLWLKNADASWAPGAFSVSDADPLCESVVVSGQEISLGEENSVTQFKKGRCGGTVEIQAFYHSGDGQIAVFYGREGDDRFLCLVDMTTGRSSERIPLKKHAGYVVKNNLLVVYEEDGRMTAYRPA